MTDDNGANGSLPEKIGNNGRDPVTGKFLKGNSGSRGRPVGTHGLPALIRREVKRRGESVANVAMELFEQLRKRSREGDVNATKIALDRLLGPVKDSGDIYNVLGVGVSMDGPPMPEGEDMRKEIRGMVEDAKRQGLID